jgi:hypothetical protein
MEENDGGTSDRLASDEEGLKEWLGDWTPNNFSLTEVRERFDQ